MNTPRPAAVNIHKKISKVKNCMNTKTEKLLVTKIILCIFSWSNYCYMCTIYTSGSLMHIIFASNSGAFSTVASFVWVICGYFGPSLHAITQHTSLIVFATVHLETKSLDNHWKSPSIFQIIKCYSNAFNSRNCSMIRWFRIYGNPRKKLSYQIVKFFSLHP